MRRFTLSMIQGRAVARPCCFRYSVSPRRYEEASSAGADGSGLALFEALAEFSQTPPDPSNAVSL